MTANNRMRYYRSKSFLGRIAAHMGFTNEEAHEFIKLEYFRKSTTEFTDDDFDTKLSEIREDFSHLGVWIPEPGEEDTPPDDTTDYSKENTNIF